MSHCSALQRAPHDSTDTPRPTPLPQTLPGATRVHRQGREESVRLTEDGRRGREHLSVNNNNNNNHDNDNIIICGIIITIIIITI